MEHTKRLTMGAILTALALALSYMERFFPLQLLVPLPGVKLGLANLVTVFALYFLTVREAGMILILRCALGSLFSTGVTAFLFSIGGGILALLVMAALKRCKGLSLYGISMAGAAAHNIGQLAVAALVLGSSYVWAYLPFLLLISLATGAITGTVAAYGFRGLLGAGLRMR